MNAHRADQISRAAARFFSDYNIPCDVIVSDERGVHIVIGWATFKTDGPGYKVTLWNRGQREYKNFDCFWSAVSCARDWNNERREAEAFTA